MKKIKIIIFLLLSFIIFKNVVYCNDEIEDLTLSRIYVEPGILEPEFSETRRYYTLLLDKNTDKLLVQATPTNENLHFEIIGNENLKEGENIITITVYSTDKSKNKVYTINALKTNTPDEYNALLNTLIIDNYPFNEDFFPEVFEYTTKDNTNDDKLEVFAYPQNQNAKVEIKNNTNLKEGENIITIKVTSPNGLATREYKIIVNKGENNKVETTQSNSNINNSTINNTTNTKGFNEFITISIIIIAILGVTIYYTSKKG